MISCLLAMKKNVTLKQKICDLETMSRPLNMILRGQACTT